MNEQTGAGRSAAIIVAGVAAVALAAQVSVPIPGTPVPQSLQTLAVVVVGAWLGPIRGGAALLLYIGLGAVGLPVFADGAGGFEHLTGPTVGYLLGFVIAAAFMGWWYAQKWGQAFLMAALGMSLGHVFILTLGWARLAMLMGASEAFAAGVGPFVVGGLVKSLVGAGIVAAAARLRAEPRSP